MPQDYIQTLASATFGGCCATIVGHPLDTVKIRIQNNSFSIKQLWKGIGPPLVARPAIWSLSFFGYKFGLDLHKYLDLNEENKHFFGGTVSGIFSVIIRTPVDCIKTIAQYEKESSLVVLRKLSLQQLFRGFWITIPFRIIQSSLFFGLFAYFQELFKKKIDDKNLISLAAGGMTGMCHWTAVLPIDIVRNQYFVNTNLTYKVCINQIYKQRGFMGFYRAWWLVMIRAVPTNAAGWWGASFMKERLSKPLE